MADVVSEFDMDVTENVGGIITSSGEE